MDSSRKRGGPRLSSGLHTVNFGCLSRLKSIDYGRLSHPKSNMNENIIKKAKEYTLRLLKYTGRKPLCVICEDSCSEVSRLLGIWFRKEMPKTKIYIAKGKIRNQAHDILIIGSNKGVDIIDPTVWQFFKNKRSIFMGKTGTIGEALHKLTEIYGGNWKISERITKYSKNELFELKKTLTKNIGQARRP